MDSVLHKLHTVYAIDYFNLEYAESKSPGSLKPWPQRNAREKEHYEPLTWLMNTILDMSRKGGIKNKFYSKLRFEVYDCEMKEGEGIDKSIKPDILGITLPDGKKVSWGDVHIPVEVKKSWPELISQMGTYAWSCLSIRYNRQFVPAIHYHHGNLEIRIGLYTRSGLVATEALCISTAQGFRQFVGAIIGIISWTPAASGIDNSRTKKYFYLPDNKLYLVGDTLCDRIYVRGHATRVHCLELARDGELDVLYMKLSKI